jgi:hypothetical protein
MALQVVLRRHLSNAAPTCAQLGLRDPNVLSGAEVATTDPAAEQTCEAAAGEGVEVMGFEPTASSMRPKRSSQLSYTPKGKGQGTR